MLPKREVSIDNGKCFICKSTSQDLRNVGDVEHIKEDMNF